MHNKEITITKEQFNNVACEVAFKMEGIGGIRYCLFTSLLMYELFDKNKETPIKEENNE